MQYPNQYLSFYSLSHQRPPTCIRNPDKTMTTTKFDTPRDRNRLGVYRQVQREKEYEEANKEARRKSSREYQQRCMFFCLCSHIVSLYYRRCATLKERSAAEQAAAREQAASYQAAYHERNCWNLLMTERRRRNTYVYPFLYLLSSFLLTTIQTEPRYLQTKEPPTLPQPSRSHLPRDP